MKEEGEEAKLASQDYRAVNAQPRLVSLSMEAGFMALPFHIILMPFCFLSLLFSNYITPM